MGFTPPTNGIPVPLVLVDPLGVRLGLWCQEVEIIDLIQIGVFAKETGSPDFTCIGGGVVLTLGYGDDFKTMVETLYGGDEMKWLNEKVLPVLNKQLDEWLRANYSWEQLKDQTLLSESQVNALPSEVDQVNWVLAKHVGFFIQTDKKTIDLSVT